MLRVLVCFGLRCSDRGQSCFRLHRERPGTKLTCILVFVCFSCFFSAFSHRYLKQLCNDVISASTCCVIGSVNVGSRCGRRNLNTKVSTDDFFFLVFSGFVFVFFPSFSTRLHRENNPNDVLPSSDRSSLQAEHLPLCIPSGFCPFWMWGSERDFRALLCGGAGALLRPPCPLFIII